MMKRLACGVLAVLFFVAPCAAQVLVGITPVVSAGAVNGLVAKAAPGSAISIYAVNFSSTSGFLVGYNATTIPSTGALTAANVIDCVPLAASGSNFISAQPGPSTNYSQGIVYLLTSASNCYTYTTGSITGFMKAVVQ
jgi:hypothetical protein